MPYLNCPKCRLTTYSDTKSLFSGECPRCSGGLSEQPARFFAVDFPTRPRRASGKQATSDSGHAAPRGAALGRAGYEAEPVHETYVATSDAVPKARLTARGWARSNGAGVDAVERIALAVTEAVANVSLHAYRADPKPGLVAIDLDGTGGEVLSITVSDEGSGIAPRSDSPGLGLGLPLIGRLADVLTVRSPAAGGTEL